MRLKSAVLISVVVSALALLTGTAGAQGQDGKPGPAGHLGDGDQRLLAAEAAAGKSTAAANPVIGRALSTIQSRIADFVATNGTRYSFGSFLDPASGKIVIETDAPDGVVSPLVGTNTGMVEIRPGAIVDTFGRCDDIAPFWGGACVTATVGITQCTTGFTVQNMAGTRSMITAGHCFANGTDVFTPPGTPMGTVAGNGMPSHDMALIGGQSYGGSIYVGGPSISNPVVAAADPVVGFSQYCFSGAVSGEQCGYNVVSVTAMVCTATGCRGPLYACGGPGLPQPQPGDSGAPFYAKNGTNVHIRGIVSAISSSGTWYGEKWSRIATRYGVSIVT